MRVSIDNDPFLHLNADKVWRERGLWPCFWIACADAGEAPFVTAYRLQFSLEAEAVIRVHVSADERYELYLDGERIGRGSERGSPHHWYFETYDLAIPAGDHVFVARVWSLGERAPIAQMSVHPGFVFAPEGEWTSILGTGVAAWEAKKIEGYGFLDPSPAFWRGVTTQIDGVAYPWGFERGEGENWLPARKLDAGAGRIVDWEFYRQHVLYPAALPPMIDRTFPISAIRLVSAVESLETRAIPVQSRDHLSDESAAWLKLLQGNGEIVIPAHTARRVLIDLENYACAYSEVVASGGAGSAIRVSWAESLRDKPDPWDGQKGYRDEIEGKFFVGMKDVFLPDGGADRQFSPLWWQAGRYVEVVVQTGDQPLSLHSLTLREIRYPLEMESRFDASDSRLVELIPLLIRGVQMNAQETYSDCPYYEELMYAGDTRLEMLLTYIMTRDERLPRKALRLFDESRLPSGLTQARFPSRKPQIIAPFALWWVGMVHEYALWRDDVHFVKSLMPGVRATMEAFQRYMGEDGLLHAPEGWNTMDWVPEWVAGMPPDAIDGISGLMNWQLIYTLELAAQLEDWGGESEIAARYRRWARELTARVKAVFWDETRGLYAEDVGKQHFSEHSQCLAILSGQLNDADRTRVGKALFESADLAQTTIYFSHYLFETCCVLGRVDVLLERLSLWFGLLENGLKTPIESPEPTRSDCHGWGAHPLFHYFATILGIRPASPGFRAIEITPQLGSLTSAGGMMVHPKGEIHVDFYVESGVLRGHVTLPDGVSGVLRASGQELPLKGGQTYHI